MGNPNAGSAVAGVGTAGIERSVVSVEGILAIAISLRFAAKYSRLLDSLSANAYGLYLVHYNCDARLIGAPRRAVATS